jgi:hypothetical protein
MEQHGKHSARLEEAIEDPRTSAPAGYRDEARPHEDEEDVLERAGVRPDVPTPAGAPDPAEVAARSELARFISPRLFPGFRDQFLASAADNDAPQWVRDSLARLPADQMIHGVSELWESMGGPAQP